MDAPSNGWGIRIAAELWAPEKVVTVTSEYSFSFDIPATNGNIQVLGFANTLSVPSKFKQRYSAQVYGDGQLLFDGSLIIQGYDAEEKAFSANLVNIKEQGALEVFGDDTLTSIDWDVDFDGAGTINRINANPKERYFFPTVGYGVFQKTPYFSDEVASEYTSKYELDKYNKWWVDSFPPSLNMLELIRRAYEQRGYSVGGSAFGDEVLNDIFLSVNLADGQYPHYPLGVAKFGAASISSTFNTQYGDVVTQGLRFPIHGVNIQLTDKVTGTTEYDAFNFADADVINLFQTNTINEPTLLFDRGEQVIVIPADGWYKLHLQGSARYSGPQTWRASQNILDLGNMEVMPNDITISANTYYSAPFEIQVVKNYDQDIELIKGKNNLRYKDGNQEHGIIIFNNGNAYSNEVKWVSLYPHQNLGMYLNATDKQPLGGDPMADTYVYADGYPMAYDPAVNDKFIMGATSLGGGTAAIIKNGRSWNTANGDKGKVMANIRGYRKMTPNGQGSSIVTNTNVNNNTLNGSPVPTGAMNSDGSLSFNIDCIVWLERNDRLEVVGVQKHYEGYTASSGHPYRYSWSGDFTFNVAAISDWSEEKMRREGIGYGSSSQFSDKLRLTDWCNRETKISDFVKNCQEAFQLDIRKQGQSVDINVINEAQAEQRQASAVDIDEQASNQRYTSELITYPRSMSVRYKIDEEEFGFENSVPTEYVGSSDWKKYADSGYTKIILNDDEYVTEDKQVDTEFSFCWYAPYLYKEQTGYNQEGSGTTLIQLPVIGKFNDLADEQWNYEESMAKDVFGMRQRFWYRGEQTNLKVYTADDQHSIIYLTPPLSYKHGTDLSYKTNGQTLLTRFYRVNPLLGSDYVTVEVFLNPLQYQNIMSGCFVKYDSSLYAIASLQGYSPDGTEPTKLKLVRL